MPDNLDLSPEDFVRLKEGDETAQRSLMKRFAPCIESLIKKRFNLSDVDAEDVAAETLYKVIINIHKFRPDGPAKFSTWVFQIAVNSARDWFRKNAKHTHFDHDVENISVHPDDGLDVEEVSEKGELVRDAMAKLDDIDRKILEWFSHDVPLVQAAEYLGMEEGTVRQRKSRALKKLKAIYETLSK